MDFPIRGLLTYENMPDVKVELEKDLPPEAVERAPKSITRKNYDTTGYAYQFVVNRLNDVLFGHWRTIHSVYRHDVGQSASGKPMYKVVVQMTMQLGNWIQGSNGREFEVLAEAECYGGHTSLEEDSAFKGAYTNAFKKVAAFFGVGKKAFEGLIDEDYRDPGDDQAPAQNNKPSSGNNGKPASEPTLNLVTKLINELAQARKADPVVVYGKLKEAIGTTAEQESWTQNTASKAIEILNDWKKKKGAA